MNSEQDIRRCAQILLGVILTDPAALDALRGALGDQSGDLPAVLEQLAGIEVSADEAVKILEATDALLDALGQNLEQLFVAKFGIRKRPFHVL
jgi:hypothetical protein